MCEISYEERRFFNESEKFEELELKDDFIFGKVMQNKEICKKTLEILFGIEIEEIAYPERAESAFTKKLALEVTRAKENKKWRREYMKEFLGRGISGKIIGGISQL